jgi:hypothetical protein
VVYSCQRDQSLVFDNIIFVFATILADRIQIGHRKSNKTAMARLFAMAVLSMFETTMNYVGLANKSSLPKPN